MVELDGNGSFEPETKHVSTCIRLTHIAPIAFPSHSWKWISQHFLDGLQPLSVFGYTLLPSNFCGHGDDWKWENHENPLRIATIKKKNDFSSIGTFTAPHFDSHPRIRRLSWRVPVHSFTCALPPLSPPSVHANRAGSGPQSCWKTGPGKTARR